MTLGVPRPDDALYRLLIGYDEYGEAVFAPPYASIIGTGAPRTGKTRGIAIPAVASFPGSTVVVSVRGDVIEQTKASRARRGPVAVFDPAGLHPLLSERTSWNMLGGCTDLQFAIEVAQSLVDGGMPQTSSSTTDWHFWGALARKLVAPCLFAAANSGRDLDDVVRWIQTREEFEVRGLIQDVPGVDSFRALQMVDGIWQSEARALSSIYSTADAMISPFESPALAQSVSGGLDVRRFLDVEGSTLYVTVPATRQSTYAPIVTMLIGSVLDAAIQRAEVRDEPARVLVVLDEAGNIGQIPDLRSRATTSMGYGIAMISLLHDVSQLRRVYGVEDAQTILGGHHVIMGLRSIDPHTATFFDGVVGSEPHDSLPNGTGIARLRRVPAGDAIVMVGGSDPQLVTLPSLDDPLLRMELDPGSASQALELSEPAVIGRLPADEATTGVPSGTGGRGDDGSEGSRPDSPLFEPEGAEARGEGDAGNDTWTRDERFSLERWWPGEPPENPWPE